jgi:hypothetical protein
VTDEFAKFQMKRVNPFQGLVIDADTWQDAHNYHRNQQRLHLLAFHKAGIVQGLEVISNEPPDLSVTIQPGLAIDPEGNTIIVTQAQHYQIQTHQKKPIYLIIQFREIPTAPYQPPEGGQATRILEGYRIQERDKLPNEPHLELARIDFDPAEEAVKNATDPSRPGKNEINLSNRQEAKNPVQAAPVIPENAPPAAQQKTQYHRETIIMAQKVLGDADKALHIDGLKNLLGEINQHSGFSVDIAESIPLDKDIDKYTILYLVGNSSFQLNIEEQEALGVFLQSGGVIFGEGCSEGQAKGGSKAIREFGLSFNQLANQLHCKLETVQRSHPILSVPHLFSSVPPGAEQNGMLLEGGHMVYSGSDYGCAWQGGHQDDPLSRDVIRSAFEMGVNIVTYAYNRKESDH